MTREEAIDRLKEARAGHKEFLSVETLNMAIKALEQEPCGDCISRESVNDLVRELGNILNGTDSRRDVSTVLTDILYLPSVSPQPKMGRWKAFTHSAYRGNDEDGEPIWREVTVYHCDLCNRRTVIKEKYCPNCGHKMQEVEE